LYLQEVIAAGIETTSTTLDWAMAEMLSNPGVLKKVQEEVDSVVGMDRMVEVADLPGLQYTKAVVKETLRKHPALPLLLPHFSMEACELELEVGADEWSSSSRREDDMQERRSRSVYYDIAEGTKVLVNAWAIQNDPRVWAEAERFKPERFMEGSPKAHVDVRGQHFELIPFGSGRRCAPA
jgi:flavonoid 3'-monooxygenase